MAKEYYTSKTPTKDGRKYYFRVKYKDIFGEWHDYTSPKYKSPNEAIEEKTKYRIKVAEQKTNTSNITINQIFYEYLENKKTKVKKQTLLKDKALYSHLNPIKDIRVNNFNLQAYKKFRAYIDSLELGTTYKNKILGLLRTLINFSNRYYNTNDGITKFIENFKNPGEIKKDMDFYTYEEYLVFDSVIEDFDYHTFFETLYYLGLRKGEAQALMWKDIDFSKETLSVSKTLMTKLKGEKWTISSPKTKSSIRTLPLPKKLLEDLKIMYNKAKEHSDFKHNWFVFGNAEPFKETTINNKKNYYCDIAKLRRIRVHDFRHSTASLLINKGASITLVSKYLGHSKISTTLNTYSHMYQSELESMTNILNNL